MKNHTISSIFGHDNPIKARIGTVPEQPHCPAPEQLYGLELEIEDTRGLKHNPSHLTPTRDESLRNNGLEYLTAPATYSQIHYMLSEFYGSNKWRKENFSERTSIHVHVDFTSKTLKQLQAFVLLYQVFERLLYQFVGHERDSNIFCVPWYTTRLSHSLIPELDSHDNAVVQIRNWMKYTGLNIQPLMRHGTVEFRHMHGTSDHEKVMTWLRIIGSLVQYSKDIKVEDLEKSIMNLNSTSAYEAVLIEVFGPLAQLWLGTPEYMMALEDGVINMKAAMIPRDKKKYNMWTDIRPHVEGAGTAVEVELQRRQAEMASFIDRQLRARNMTNVAVDRDELLRGPVGAQPN